MSADQTWLPEPSERSAPFFEAAREGVLRLQRCPACDTWTFPFRKRCQQCGATELEWSDSRGRGTLYSHALLRRQYHPRHEGRLPLILAWIDLDEGVRIPSNVVDVEPDALRVGMPVEVAFETFPDGGVIPVFRPAEA